MGKISHGDSQRKIWKGFIMNEIIKDNMWWMIAKLFEGESRLNVGYIWDPVLAGGRGRVVWMLWDIK